MITKGKCFDVLSNSLNSRKNSWSSVWIIKFCVWVLGLSISSGVRGVGILHAVIMVIGEAPESLSLSYTGPNGILSLS